MQIMVARQGAPGRRRYTSTRRAAQAAQTRRDVIDSAIALFDESGWSATTLPAIAARAEVAVDTIYSGFGSKKALLREAIDVAVVGDDEPVPLAERPEFRALGEGPVEERMRRGITLNAEIQRRAAGLWGAMLEAAPGDPEIAGWATELEQGRRLDLSRGLERILGLPVDNRTLDVLWALLGSEVFLKLRSIGWTFEEYTEFMLDATRRILGR
jgi:AcrR family transcriptional regulator